MLLTPDKTAQIADLLLAGNIGVLPTDTVYGLHCLAQDITLRQEIIDLKGRDAKMPMITLISSIAQLANYDLAIGKFEQTAIATYWPGPNTLIFKTSTGETLSFRLPANPFLTDILNRTGPLISTSANLHGKPHATTIQQAQDYFGAKVDFYVDGGELTNAPSSVYKVYDGVLEKLR